MEILRNKIFENFIITIILFDKENANLHRPIHLWRLMIILLLTFEVE